ncbi:Intersectin 1 (SH3 domain protein) [Allomyces javanicus]|nr:Intersectin 1 (SH3 domain protein) [Allomyces javanicus]
MNYAGVPSTTASMGPTSGPLPALPSYVAPADWPTYTHLFRTAARGLDGRRIGADQARAILVQSGVPNDVLAHVWTLADTSRAGSLTFPEFCLAMALVKRAREHPGAVPATLPPHIRNEIASLNIQLGVATPSSAGSVSVAPVPAPVSPWTLTQDDRAQFAAAYTALDPLAMGFVGGDQCRDVMQRSGLAGPVLGKIWALVDVRGSGALTQDEFAVAMKLIAVARSGRPVPDTLPPELAAAISATPAPRSAILASSSPRGSVSTDDPDAAGYVSKHRRRPGAVSVSTTGASSPRSRAASTTSAHRVADLQRRIAQSRELLRLKRDQKRAEAAAAGVAGDEPVAVRRLHREIADLQAVLRSLRAQYADRRRSMAAAPKAASSKANSDLIGQIMAVQEQLNGVQLSVFRIRDQKRHKYPPLPVATESVDLTALLAAPKAATVTMSEADRRKQKAAEMLAQRMAALGVGSSTGASTSSATTLTPAHQDAVRRIEAERERLKLVLAELRIKLEGMTDPRAAEPFVAEFEAKLREMEPLLVPVDLPAEYREGASRPQPAGIGRVVQQLERARQEPPPAEKPASARPVQAPSAYAGPAKQVQVPSAFTSSPFTPPPPVQKPAPVSKWSPAAKPTPPPPVSPLAKPSPVPEPAPSDLPQARTGNVKDLASKLFGPPVAQPKPTPASPPKRWAVPSPTVAPAPAPAAAPADFNPFGNPLVPAQSAAPPISPPPPPQLPVRPKSRSPPPPQLPVRRAAVSPAPAVPIPAAPVQPAVPIQVQPPSPAAPAYGDDFNPFATIGRGRAVDDHVTGGSAPLVAAPNPFGDDDATPLTSAPPAPVPGFHALDLVDPPKPVPVRTTTPVADPFADLLTPESPTVVNAFVDENLTAAAAASTAPPAVRVLYDYAAVSAGDLACRAGERLSVIDEDGEWVHARNTRGEDGWVPSTYVVKESADGDGRRARVLYDYEAQHGDEMSVAEGALVTVVDDTADAEWWMVMDDGGRSGLVPATYLERIANRPASVASSIPPDPFVAGDSDAGSMRSPPMFAIQSAWPDSSTSPTGSAAHTAAAHDTSHADWLAVPSLRHKRSTQSVASHTTTWSSTMQPSLLASLGVEEKKRQEAIFELIVTEQAYVRDLQTVADLFIQPLMGARGREALADVPGGHEATVKTLFGNWEELLVTNVAFLSDLELRQEKDDGLIEAPGGLILDHIQGMKCYMSFCAGQKRSIERLSELMQTRPAMAEFVQTAQADPRCRSLDLGSYLLKPMQRMTRYPLLIKQVLHYTPEAHSDHKDLMAALAAAEANLHAANEAARDDEDRTVFAEIVGKVDLRYGDTVLDLASPTRTIGKRHFILEGELAKAKSGRRLYAYLFNDLILLTEERRSERGLPYALYRPPILLSEVRVERDHSRPAIFSLILHNMHDAAGANPVITLRCASQSTRNNWANKIDAAIAAVQQAVTAGGASAAALAARPILGTLRVVVVEGLHLNVVADALAAARLNLLCEVTVPGQPAQRTRTVKNATAHPAWNEPLMFSVQSLDDTLRLVVFNAYDKFSQEDYLGTAEMPLHILEYFGNQETVQDLPLQNGPASGGIVPAVRVRVQYRSSTSQSTGLAPVSAAGTGSRGRSSSGRTRRL